MGKKPDARSAFWGYGGIGRRYRLNNVEPFLTLSIAEKKKSEALKFRKATARSSRLPRLLPPLRGGSLRAERQAAEVPRGGASGGEPRVSRQQ